MPNSLDSTVTHTIGFQTIIFGRRIRNLAKVLRIIKKAGFQGVEFFQHHKNIRIRGVKEELSFDRLRKFVEDKGLKLMGLAGGTLKDRYAYLSSSSNLKKAKEVYLYLDNLRDSHYAVCAREGYLVAVHPHAFTNFERVQDVLDDVIFKEYPNVKLIPDTAHMFVVGDDPDTWHGLSSDKILAVHLKDWDAAYGRAHSLYTRGFTELKRGNVPLEELVNKFISKWNVNTWVLEQDYSGYQICDSIVHGVRGLYELKLRDTLIEIGEIGTYDTYERLNQKKLRFDEAKFAADIYMAAEGEISDFYRNISFTLKNLYKANYVGVWSYSQARQHAYLMGSTAESELDLELEYHESIRIVEINGAFLESAAASLEPWHATIDIQGLLSVQGKVSEKQPTGIENEWFRKARSSNLIVLAVGDKYNPHQVRLLISIFTNREYNREYYEESFEYIESILSHGADICLNRRKTYVEGKVNQLRAKRKSVDKYAEELSKLISEELLPCACASIFLQTFSRTLTCRTPENVIWTEENSTDTQFYNVEDANLPVGQGPPCQTAVSWVRGTTAFLQNDRDKSPAPIKSRSKVLPRPPLEGGKRRDTLIVPFRPYRSNIGSGSNVVSIGVIRCTNRLSSPGDGSRMFFTDDDAALLTAICEDAVPQLELLLEREYVGKYILTLMHELKKPVVGIRNDLILASRHMSQVKTTLASVANQVPDMHEVLLENIERFQQRQEDLDPQIVLLERLVDDAYSAILVGEQTIEVQRQLVDIRTDLFDIVLKHLSAASEGVKFKSGQVVLIAEPDFPKIYVDFALCYQIFQNLISNALKYGRQDKEGIVVRVQAEISEGSIVVTFTNTGEGIPQKFKESIFEQGVRAPSARHSDIPGYGIGLWLVRRFVEAQDGTISLESCIDPTVFRIKLPLLSIVDGGTESG